MTAIDDDPLDRVLRDAMGTERGRPLTVSEFETWHRVDLGPALDGRLERALPTVFVRDDNQGLFYPARVNGVHGDSGTGKSIVLALAAAQELNGRRDVAWIDFEDPDPSTIVERLRMFDVPDNTIRTRLHYYAPRDPFTGAAIDRLVVEIRHCSLVVIDSVGEAFALENINENDDLPVARWMREVARYIAEHGPAVGLLDHSTKASDNPLHPSGSKRKRAAITGASYLLEVERSLSRADGGRIRLVVAKDRHGNYKRGARAATVDLAVYPDGGVSAKVWAPLEDGETSKDVRIQLIAIAAVNAVRDAGRALTQRELLELMTVQAKTDLKRAGIDRAVGLGAIRVEHGSRQAVMHIYVRDLEP